MTITSGTRLGPYEVVAPLGAGGMGEVWKARDTRLERSVAIKVLPAEFAENAQLKLRFEREAKTISQLNHPHICTLYDVGDGYLVMELLEGESLAEKLAKGPLPVDQVLRYGIQIAEALDKAHKAGVVHRDLKPGNIMITKGGAKLLDFGLAKPTEGGVISALTSLRTEQKNALTEEGTIVGTFQYMAPEQIEGAEVDARTDIFALGVVLYEMATGKRAFAGKTKASLIASILTAEPQPISAVQPMTPVMFDRVVRKCLQKEPEDRWQSASDVATALRWTAEEPVTSVRAARKRGRIGEVLAILFAVAAAVLGWLWFRASKEPPTVQSYILPPPKTSFGFGPSSGSIAVSPDGTRLAALVTSEGRNMIWLRPLNGVTWQPLAGTDGARFPFWSPDSRFIAFFSAGKLKKIDANGGPPQPICDTGSQPRGGSWNREGVIIFASSTRDPIVKVSAEGGAPVAVTKLGKGEFSHRWPAFLPDGRHFMYFVQTFSSSYHAKISVATVEGSEPARPLLDANGPALYSPDGFLVFPRDRTLLAQRFNPKTLRLNGEAFPVAETVESFAGTTATTLSVSNNGVLVYRTGEAAASNAQLAWFDRTGKEIEVLLPPGNINRPRLSHDGKRIAYEQVDPRTGFADIWVLDLARKVPTRLTFDPADEIYPLWSADDSKIYYTMTQPNGAFDLYEKQSTGSALPEVLFRSNAVKIPNDVTADGRTLLFANNDPAGKTTFDEWQLSLASHVATPVIVTPFAETYAHFSPDGKWIAYVSDPAGADVFIESFPPRGGKWQVTAGGANNNTPVWSRDGKELFFRANDRLMSVDVRASNAGLEISTPKVLFETHFRAFAGYQYDVSPDGKRFLINVGPASDVAQPLTLVTNWTSGIRK